MEYHFQINSNEHKVTRQLNATRTIELNMTHVLLQ